MAPSTLKWISLCCDTHLGDSGCTEDECKRKTHNEESVVGITFGEIMVFKNEVRAIISGSGVCKGMKGPSLKGPRTHAKSPPLLCCYYCMNHTCLTGDPSLREGGDGCVSGHTAPRPFQTSSFSGCWAHSAYGRDGGGHLDTQIVRGRI